MLLRLAIETRKLCRIKSMNHLREKLVLASSSPRRTEILERAGWPHEVMVAGIDETVLPNEDPAAYVQRLARSKAEAVRSEEHTSELQSLAYLVCRLLLEKKTQ